MKLGDNKETNMTFKVVSKSRGSVSKDPAITVSSYALHFNKAADDAFEISEFDYIELHLDEDSSQIGVKLLTEQTPESNKLKNKESSKRTVSAKGWINTLGITPGRYELSAKESDFLTFDLVAAEAAEEDEQEVVEMTPRKRGRPRKAA
jgi:hypothetical protein